MISVKSTIDKERGGCELNISIEGYGDDILHESLAVIKGIMGSLKNESKQLHLLAIAAIADDPTILIGDEQDDDIVSMGAVQHVSFKGGIN